MFLAVTAATSVAFFAMVGFEDSVNMVEETQDPERIFPRTMLTGLGIAVIIYMLVAVAVVAVLTPGELAEINEAEGRALLEVVSKGAPDFPIDKVFPFLAVFAVANTALINMLMASRLLYGLANQDVLPRSLGKVSPNSRAPYVGDRLLHAAGAGPDLVRRRRRPRATSSLNLASTTALLLLGVFTVVNVACLVLRRRRTREHVPVARLHAGARRGRCCAFLVGPWVDRDALHLPDRRRPAADRRRAVGAHLADQPGQSRAKKTGFRDIDHMEDDVR